MESQHTNIARLARKLAQTPTYETAPPLPLSTRDAAITPREVTQSDSVAQALVVSQQLVAELKEQRDEHRQVYERLIELSAEQLALARQQAEQVAVERDRSENAEAAERETRSRERSKTTWLVVLTAMLVVLTLATIYLAIWSLHR